MLVSAVQAVKLVQRKAKSFLQAPLVHSLPHLGNGHPYKIVVNGEEEIPFLLSLRGPQSTTSKKSEVIWVTKTGGFNGKPINILSFPANAMKYWQNFL